MRDLPSVKLAYAAYKEQGFTVVSVHNNSQTADAVKAFAAANQMTFPIVVDNEDGEILAQYTALGVTGFPSYILLGLMARSSPTMPSLSTTRA